MICHSLARKRAELISYYLMPRPAKRLLKRAT